MKVRKLLKLSMFAITLGASVLSTTAHAFLGSFDGQVTITCAPEVVEGNLAATDRILIDLSKTDEFSSATQFKSTVEELSKISDNKEKVNKYFSLVGVNGNSSKEVVEFIGARTHDKYMPAAVKNLGLNAEQARTLVSEMAAGLKGQ